MIQWAYRADSRGWHSIVPPLLAEHETTDGIRHAEISQGVQIRACMSTRETWCSYSYHNFTVIDPFFWRLSTPYLAFCSAQTIFGTCFWIWFVMSYGTSCLPCSAIAPQYHVSGSQHHYWSLCSRRERVRLSIYLSLEEKVGMKCRLDNKRFRAMFYARVPWDLGDNVRSSSLHVISCRSGRLSVWSNIWLRDFHESTA